MTGWSEFVLSEGQKLANKWGCPFIETSGKMSINVEEAFVRLVLRMRLYREACNRTLSKAPQSEVGMGGSSARAAPGCCSGCVIA
jgi:GTPase KRas